MGDALRGEMCNASFVDVSHAVREALADENIAEQMATSVSKPLPETSTEKSGFFDLSAWFKPVAGMAVAASVAVVMVVTVTGQDNAGIAPVATNTGTQQQAQPAVRLAAEQLAAKQLAAKQLAVEDKAVDSKESELNAYINQHLEFATHDTLQGRLPYVRAVSFESKENPPPSK